MRVVVEDGCTYNYSDEKSDVESYLRLALDLARWPEVEIKPPEPDDGDWEWTLMIGPIGLSCYFEKCGLISKTYRQEFMVWEETWEAATRSHPGGPDMKELGVFKYSMNSAVEFAVMQMIRYNLEHARYAACDRAEADVYISQHGGSVPVS